MFGRKRSDGKATQERRSVPPHEIVAAVLTDVGCVREINEDSGRFVRPDDEASLKQKGALPLVAAAPAEDSAEHGMGTTGTALCLQDGQAFAAHVGDSRLYMFREGKFYQLTEDRSEERRVGEEG